MITKEEIYNYISNAITTDFPECYVTGKYEPIPKSLPCVFAYQQTKTRQTRYATLDNEDVQNRIVWEIQVYAEMMNECYSIIDTIEATMKSMGFYEEFCQPTTNADPRIFRVILRFGRVLADNDTI